MAEYSIHKINDLLYQEKREVILDDKTEYKLVGVKWYGKGLFIREQKKGSEIKASKLYEIKEGDFIYNRLFAWKSSFAIATKEFDGCYVSNEFPTFKVKNGKVNLNYLLRYILQPFIIDKIDKTSGGMSSVSRKRFKENDFLNFEMPLPPLKIQSEIINGISKKEEKINLITDEIDKQKNLINDLRQSILQEAIEGKLTAKWREKNPDLITGENSAQKLLEKIKVEKERLVKEGKIKKQKPLPPVTDEEKPFELPEGWVWCRLGEVGIFERGKSKHRPRNDRILFKDGEYPFIQTGDVSQSKNTGYRFKSYSKMYNQIGLKQSRLWPKGTLCITIAANIAETGFLDIDACFPDSIVGFTSITGEKASQYIQYFFQITQNDIIQFAPATAQKNINLGIIWNLLFPLPPLSEQQEIVKKVNILMKKIDAIYNETSERNGIANRLMKIVLKEAFGH